MRIIECPICEAENWLDVEDKEGETIFCAYCGAPIKLVKKGLDDDELEGEEDEDY